MTRTRSLWLLYLAGVTLLVYLAFSGWAYDDPFITYRYAYNLSHGQGFVYNPGERVQSTTTPLFALLLAALAPLRLQTPHLANLIGAFSLAAGALLLWDLARSWRSPLVGWTGLLLYPSFSLLLMTLGSETPLYLALCLGAFAAYARRRYVLTAAFSALAILARPDGVLVPILLAIDYLAPLILQRRSLPGESPPALPWKALLVFLGLTLPWFVFAWGYFGSPLPVTLTAKQHQGAMVISQRFAPGFLTLIQSYARRWYYWIEAALALLGIITMSGRLRRWTLFLSWTALYFLAYSILGVSRYYWYYAPLVPGFIALVGLGISALGELATIVPSRLAIQIKLSYLLPAALLAVLFFSQVSGLWQLRQQLDPRISAYRAVGEWLQANTPQQAKVGALEVGIIGYYARRLMVDFAGLIQPPIAAQLTADTTYEDSAQWAVQKYQPDYLVLPQGALTALEQGYVAQRCRIAQRFPGQKYGYSVNLDVYACR